MGILSNNNSTSNDLLVKQRSGWTGAKGRLRREDCRFVKHDKLFSKWKVLVGPSDLTSDQVASPGQEDGTGKFYTYNLPGRQCGPGVYELGVTAPSWSKIQPTMDQRSTRALTRDDVIPVYIGQAANIRQRLHKYGRAGAHLEPGNSRSPCQQLRASNGRSPHRGVRGSDSPARGSRLFSEVLGLGSCIAFRWAQTDSKVVAEQVESELRAVFDYAWNRSGASTSGSTTPRRSRDILAKLFMTWPAARDHTSSFRKLFISSKRLLWLTPCSSREKAVGIKVALRKPITSSKIRRRVWFLMTMRSCAAMKVADSLDLRSTCSMASDHHAHAHAHAYALSPPSTGATGRTRPLQNYEIKRLAMGRGRPPPAAYDPPRRRDKSFSYSKGSLLSSSLTRTYCKVGTGHSAKEIEKLRHSADTTRRHNSLSFSTWMPKAGDTTDLDQRVDHVSDMTPAMKQYPSVSLSSGASSETQIRVHRYLGSKYASLTDTESKRR